VEEEKKERSEGDDELLVLRGTSGMELEMVRCADLGLSFGEGEGEGGAWAHEEQRAARSERRRARRGAVGVGVGVEGLLRLNPPPHAANLQHSTHTNTS